MALDLKGVHVYEKVPGTIAEMRLVRTNPYVRIMGHDFPAPLYIQGGRVYAEGGPEVTDYPPSWDDEIAKLSPQIKAEIGWTDMPKPTSEPSKIITQKMWTCPDPEACQQKMPIPLRKKGIHVARFHRRRVEPAGEV